MNEEEIFHQALARSPEQRAAYLEQACSCDPALRAAVEALLRANVGATGFLERPSSALVATVDAPPVSEGPGTVIGPYKLLEQIGEGGFGVVFMTEQTQPVRRKVALKILKPGMDTRQVVARFEAERQALAIMDHPHIAKVLDGGQTTSGRPYFVMDLVKGLPITEYCDQAQLTPRERLELFLQVCQAVQHAHQKGVIHRDLKPSNVLVVVHDTTPVVKVIDFGVAKALGQELTDKTLFTGFAQLVGTPLYMSPEQAGQSGVDIDTRSDIYSLGVLLYELLTGTTPFDRERLKEAAYDELRRIIREEEPPKPSTRISTLGKAATTVSTQRKSDPKRLSQLFRGELDWIVMKCLEKDRSRRYETANGLAKDIERYLRDEPVLACPPSAWYRFGKFARRNRAALAIAGALLLLVIGGLAVSNWFVSRQRDLAVRSERERTLELFKAKLVQARANRLSRRQGQRFGTLEILKEAMELGRELHLPPEHLAELRNEAIACLALTDVRLAHPLQAFTPGGGDVNFDGTLERYARIDFPGGKVSVRRVAGDEEIARVPVDGFGYPFLSRDGQYLAVHRDGSLQVWIWKLNGAHPVVVGKDNKLTSFAFSPDSRQWAAGHADGSVSLYELGSGKEILRVGKGAAPSGLAYHPCGTQLAVFRRASVHIHELKTGKLVTQFALPGSIVAQAPAWHPQGQILAVHGGDARIYLWDLDKRRLALVLQEPLNGGIHLAFNHAGDLLAATGWDGKVRLWDPFTGQQLFSAPAFGSGTPRFSADDRLLAPGIGDGVWGVCEVAAGREYRTLVRDPGPAKPLSYAYCAVSGKHRLLAVAMRDGVGLWDLPRGRLLAFLPVGYVQSVLFDPSGALLTNGPGGVRQYTIQPDAIVPGLLRIGSGQKLALPGSDSQMATSRDGGVLASAHHDKGGLLWRRDRPDPPIPLPHEDVRYIAVSPDGAWIATGSHGASPEVRVWDARSSKLVTKLAVGGGSQVGFSPDGKWLATTGGGVRLWSVPSWDEGPRIGGGPAFSFSPDARLLAVETGNGTVRLVDPGSGREYARLEDPNQDRAWNLAFSPDGTQLVANGEGHWIHVWDLRLIRDELANMGLGWDLPPFPSNPVREVATPLQVKLDLGD